MSKRKDIGDLSVKPTSKTVSWKIPNFFSLPLDVDFLVASSRFQFANATWLFRLYPNGRSSMKSEDHLDLTLIRVSSNVPCQILIVNFVILNIYGKRYDSYFQTFHFNKKNRERGVSSFLKRSKISDDASEIAPDGTLDVICQLSSNESCLVDVTSQTASCEMDSNVGTLFDDYKNLWKNGKDYDLTLKVKDKEFRAHQSILRARSQVFDSMLNHDMIEKTSGIINMTDCDPQAMEQFLCYVYSGQVETLDQDNMLGLYYAADKYNMMHLKEKCHEFIKISMSPTKICDVITLALDHSDSTLLDCATEYFLNNTNDIFPKIEWMTFMKEKSVVANELLIKLSKKITDAKA